MQRLSICRVASLAAAIVAVSLAALTYPEAALEAKAHTANPAGTPGDPKMPARTIKVRMYVQGKKMLYEPSSITVRRGDQIRFVIYNEGYETHEFILSTVAANRKHAALMNKYPHMEHADPNAVTLAPFNGAEILWQFTKRGEFEYACLIPGHLKAGMHGKVTVK